MVQVLNLEELRIKFPPKSCMSHLFLLFVYDLRDNCISILEIFYQNQTHQVQQLIIRVMGNQVLLIDRSLELQKPHHCQHFFSIFQLVLSSSIGRQTLCKNHIDIEIKSSENMIVFNHINIFRILYKHLIKCLQVCNYFLDFFTFLYTEVTSADFNSEGKSEF